MFDHHGLMVDVKDEVTAALLRAEVLTVDNEIAALAHEWRVDEVGHDLAIAQFKMRTMMTAAQKNGRVKSHLIARTRRERRRRWKRGDMVLLIG